jgi:hypothetical protein
MGKATELKTTTNIVKEVLTHYPATRNSDDLLYIKVCERINPIVINLPFIEVLSRRKELAVPPFESVRRSRQKVQAENPFLVANIDVQGYRKENERVFQEYARGNV